MRSPDPPREARSLVLDLKKPEGRSAFLRLVETADVVVENFRGGVMKALGLGYEALSVRNPRLVYTAITGFGSDGPAAGKPGFDPVMQARSGFCRAQGGDDEPVLHQVAYTDYMAGTLAAFATVAALLERERTGYGRHVDVSLYRTAFAMQAAEIVESGGRLPERKGGRDFLGRGALYRAYPTRDGWIFLAVSETRQADAIAAALDLPGDASGLLVEPAHGAVADRIASAFAGREKEALATELRRLGVPAAPCLGFDEVFRDPHLLANGLIHESAHPRLGIVRQTGEILRFSRTPMVLGERVLR
ncbi:MAG: CaiB/BaiF CoA transferase family protein [Candidatus Binatia bacterium]